MSGPRPENEIPVPSRLYLPLIEGPPRTVLEYLLIRFPRMTREAWTTRLDRGAVKSVRYRGPLFKGALAAFVLVFIVLGYFGTQPVTTMGTLLSQLCTLIYFAFFLLMPWYTRMDMTKPEPARLTWGGVREHA